MKNTTLVIALLIFSTGFASSQEFGIASYYSDKFQGKKTASGELYQRDKMTCAHKTLPFGTLVKVTRLDNNQSVRLRVNDRGPYVSGWITDVSYKAAQTLGMIGKGNVKVKLEVLEFPGKTPESTPVPPAKPEVISEVPEKKPEMTAKGADTPKEAPKEVPKSQPAAPVPVKKTATAPVTPTAATAPTPVAKAVLGGYGLYKFQPAAGQTGFAIQVSSLREFDNLMNLVGDLQRKGAKNVLVSYEKGSDSNPVFKVLMGPFTTAAAAEKALSDARKKKWIAEGYVIDLKSLRN